MSLCHAKSPVRGLFVLSLYLLYFYKERYQINTDSIFIVKSFVPDNSVSINFCLRDSFNQSPFSPFVPLRTFY